VKSERPPTRLGQISVCAASCCRMNPRLTHRIDESFGEALSDILVAHGVTQYRLCQLTGLGGDVICRLVHDVRPPTEAQALRICLSLALGVSESNRLLEAGNLFPVPTPAPGARGSCAACGSKH